ncbi:30S ribosomal protein S17 [candidate division WWE3 bacterium RIFOXYC1_FULL_40_10]|uniref:30S ribosomal protein S17 n=1 Tax=candidate division WWE3 bacterium RIFOXYA2_FULL_46_9 TaxID=1802636 RepID=A0A1F4VYG6_UNCKA|nr:MAG: 30S ribosomal protein S17 [candidate division WWE3 bacterium RIFOXYB1_FULL_40_22]OGC61860.1 MAG: 30S ribosomal protein S17 [candidate division WWE3 bacterium RIFOXYA1_FULL_40_11]OGC62226.1 MAG: 30S ribosomal protein S17 [candidate division WWE3 bacterium RIFOXYA2_FULL_46_9]OGC64332.1 MAG: 30S ribosomal protein S17 [candidate division WWE3 bacterium RIFOXYB2_FULL_41_6]OGC66243.1 MAG: 30S ribosomal protein S17 [candidate division WWE3 bacterium RIFOXYC1_FULL_40_10]OGC67849.1 MAG: 30S rib
MAKRRLKGQIVSNKMNKTVVVAVLLFKQHPIYKKTLKNTRRFKARVTEPMEIGKEVIIEECAPLSKEVSWKVVEE